VRSARSGSAAAINAQAAASRADSSCSGSRSPALARSLITLPRRPARSSSGRPGAAFEHMLELYPGRGRPGRQMARSAGADRRAGHSSSVTLDVKFLVWITYDPGVHCPGSGKSSMHRLRVTFPQAEAPEFGCAQQHPQRSPQPAHSPCGVSAHAVHRPVHSMNRRVPQLAGDCPRRSIEQARVRARNGA
jgi:hypothetical protein